MQDNRINSSEVIDFFNRCAPTWDQEMIRYDDVISKIIEGAGIDAGKRVLDVACGTGVLIPDYLKREVAGVVGVDISPKMIEFAREKFDDDRLEFRTGDIYDINFDEKFDCVMVYNAFPHFSDSQGLIERLANQLKEGGTLTVAHGMSRDMINRHHCGEAAHVSKELIEVEDLATIFRKYLQVKVCISDENMYQVTGILG